MDAKPTCRTKSGANGIDVFPLKQAQNTAGATIKANFIIDDGADKITIEDKVVISRQGLTILPNARRSRAYTINQTTQVGPNTIEFKIGSTAIFTADILFLVVGRVVHVSLFNIESAGEQSEKGIMVADASFLKNLALPVGTDEVVDIALINWVSRKNENTVNRANNNAVLRLKKSSREKLFIENGTKDATEQFFDFSNITFTPFSTSGVYITG